MANVLRRDESGGKPVATETIGGIEYPTIKLYDSTAGSTTPTGTSANPLPVAVYSGLVPEAYDELVLSYTGVNLTGVVYKLATVTVATLTLGYTGSDLTSVVRT